MQIAIDCRMWGKTFGGIGRYVQEIVTALLLTKGWEMTLIVASSDIVREIEVIPEKKAICRFVVCNAKMFSLKEQLALPRAIPACDVFWSPYMNVPFMPCKAKKRVVTLHDVFHLANPQYYSWIKRLMVKPFYYFSTRSDLILTVSDFSKQEIVKYCGSHIASKIKTIYNGCDIDVSRINPVDRDFKYLLFVGNVKPHKNLKNALLGFQQLNDSNLRFVIVGKKEGFVTGDSEVFDIVSRLNDNGERVIFTGNVSDSELFSWYKGATALVQPSYYEGFGLPIVEAMQFGLPIACSDIPVFREIGKDAVNYFNPYSPDSIAKCLKQVAVLPRQHYEDWMTWKETAEQIVVELEKLVSA